MLIINQWLQPNEWSSYHLLTRNTVVKRASDKFILKLQMIRALGRILSELINVQIFYRSLGGQGTKRHLEKTFCNKMAENDQIFICVHFFLQEAKPACSSLPQSIISNKEDITTTLYYLNNLCKTWVSRISLGRKRYIACVFHRLLLCIILSEIKVVKKWKFFPSLRDSQFSGAVCGNLSIYSRIEFPLYPIQLLLSKLRKVPLLKKITGSARPLSACGTFFWNQPDQ